MPDFGKELADLGSGVVEGFITRQVANKESTRPCILVTPPHSNCTSEPDIDKPYSSSDLCIANVIFVFNIFLLNIPADIIICSSIPPEGELVAVHLSGLWQWRTFRLIGRSSQIKAVSVSAGPQKDAVHF